MKSKLLTVSVLSVALTLLTSAAGATAQVQPLAPPELTTPQPTRSIIQSTPPDISTISPLVPQHTAGIAGNGIGSLGGSLVAFDPSAGGDTCFLPGESATFCFRAESFTDDREYALAVWERFPVDWAVTDVYLQGTPSCDQGGTWGTFSWSFETAPHEVSIYHRRYQSSTDRCVAYYCFDAITGTGTLNALISWYWDGDEDGSPPHAPCSSDIYTPASMASEPCDQAIHPPASIPPCTLAPIMLTPAEIDARGCAQREQPYTFGVWNNTGYDTNVNLTYHITSGGGSCSGPAHIFVPNGTTQNITVALNPAGNPGDTVVCQISAEDATNPANNDTSQIVEELVVGHFDPAGWQPAPITGATPHQWAAGVVGTHPAASGPVGYVVGGLASPSTLNPDLQMYDPDSGAWTQLADMPNPRFSPVAGWIGGLLYAAGGFNSVFAATNDLQVYHPATDSWDNTTYADMPNPRGGGAGGVGTCSTGAGECLFHVGGGLDSSFANTTQETWQYDPATNTWTQLDNKPAGSSPSGHIFGAGVGCMGYIYVGGDYRGYHEFYRLDATQPSGSQWTRLANIPADAGAMTPALVCKEDWGKIVLLGGDLNGSWGNYNNTVYVYDIASDTWEGPLVQTLSVAQLGSVGWHMGDRVWTVGGSIGDGPISPMPFEAIYQTTCRTPTHHISLPLVLCNR